MRSLLLKTQTTTMTMSHQQQNSKLKRLSEHQSLLDQATACDVPCVPTDFDKKEAETVRNFMDNGCGCQLLGGQSCSLQFTPDHVSTVRTSCCDLSRTELDMVVLGQMMASMNLSETVVAESRHRETTRQKPRSTFMHEGKRICAHMFQFLHTIGE